MQVINRRFTGALTQKDARNLCTLTIIIVTTCLSFVLITSELLLLWATVTIIIRRHSNLVYIISVSRFVEKRFLRY